MRSTPVSGVGAGEVAGHRDGLGDRGGAARQAVVDHQVAVLGAGIAVVGVERRVSVMIGRSVSGSIPVIGARIEMRSAVPPLGGETLR